MKSQFYQGVGAIQIEIKKPVEMLTGFLLLIVRHFLWQQRKWQKETAAQARAV
jgi:hypothetical protein